MFNFEIPNIVLESKEALIAVGAMAGATLAGVATVMASGITSRFQFKIAKLNNEKDIQLAQLRATDEYRKAELTIKREALAKIYTVIHNICKHYTFSAHYRDNTLSLTKADIQKRVEEHASRFSEASAMTAIHFPELLSIIEEIQGATHGVWIEKEMLLGLSASEDTPE